MAILLLQEAVTSWDLRSILSNPFSHPVFTAIVSVFVLFWLALVLLPFGNLLKRTGHQAAWCLFFVVPFVNLIALWIFAFKPWPIDKSNP